MVADTTGKYTPVKKIKKYGDNLSRNKNGKIYDRYYYIFKVDEIIRLFNQTGWKVISHTWEYGNEVFIIKNGT